MQVLYGKDIYTANMDLGIMDGYDSSLMGLYEAMKNSKENMEQIAESAYLYDCHVLVVDSFENAPDQVGNYRLEKETGKYLIFVR